MSDKLNLNCWLLGDDPRRFFPVEIAKTKTIGALKEAIKEGPSSKGDFDGIDAQYLDLWKVNIDLKKDQKLLKTIKVDSDIQGGGELEPEKLGELDLVEEEALWPGDEMSEVFPESPFLKYLHIVVRRPPAAITTNLPSEPQLDLNCLVLEGDISAGRVFSVKIAKTEKVDGLKKAIKKEKNAGYAADLLDLWKVSILVNRTFKETISKLDFDDGQSLLPMEGLWEVFSESPVPKHLHIVVRAPPAVPNSAHLVCSITVEGQKRDSDHVFSDGGKGKRRRISPAPAIYHELSSSGMQVAFSDKPKKTRKQMQGEIVQFVDQRRENIRQLLTNAGDVSSLTPSWVPGQSVDFGDKDFVDNIAQLAIPVVNQVPSLLLHDIGEERTHLDQGQAERISRVFSFSNHKMLINTPGSGKTRLILDGLCRHWGFYFTVVRTAGIGSGDFRTAMQQLDDSLDYGLAKRTKDSDAMQHMKQKAHHRLMQLLLARFILLKLLIQEARKLPGGLHVKNHRRAWVLLQVQPSKVFGEDIFHSLTMLLRYESIVDLETEIQAHYKDLENILELSINPATGKLEKTPIYCVVDESQLLISARKGEFISDNSVTERPSMRQVFLSFTEILPSEEMVVIFSGTSLDYQSLVETLASQPLKLHPYDIVRDIGAFEDRDSQARYIQHYLKVDWTQPNWISFLDRAWGWCRGRYRSTATLILSILMGGYQSPHSILNQYVFAFTKFLPTDGQKWVLSEPILHSNFNIRDKIMLLAFDRMNDREKITLCSALFNHILYGSYSLEPFEPEERDAFITIGFARHKPGNITVIDEPLAILAGLTWLSGDTPFSLLECLRHDLGKHSPRKNGFEAYLSFHLRKVFETTPKLNQVFTFRDDFARMPELPWQHDEFDLVTVTGSQISVVTPSSGPSSNVGLLAQSHSEVLEWISTNALQFTFCFPPEAVGPDVLFFIQHKKTSQLLLLMVQARNYSTVDLKSLIMGVRTVTPSWLWKSKNINHSSPDDAPFVATNEGPRLYSSVHDAFANIRRGLKAPNASYPILRVFASWPGDAVLGRTLCYKEPTTKQKKAAKKNEPQATELANVPDPDLHPLATLHMANFKDIGKTLSRNWFLGDIEQKEVVYSQHPPIVERLHRSERIRNLAHRGAQN